jgi:CRP/FNR family cyclic AMP-dependent transcriptional regulator
MTTVRSPALETSGHAASVLDHLPRPVRDRLAALSTVVQFGAGSMVLREGADTPFLGIVETGRVGLRLRVPERGAPLTIVTIEPGEMLGWSAVVAPYRATVDAVATESSRLVTLDAGLLREHLARDHELAATLLPLVLESLSARLTGSWSQLLDLFATQGVEPW